MGSNFLKVTIDTAKLRSSLSILSRNSCGKLAMSAHFFIFLKNSIRLTHHNNALTFSNTAFVTKETTTIIIHSSQNNNQPMCLTNTQNQKATIPHVLLYL